MRSAVGLLAAVGTAALAGLPFGAIQRPFFDGWHLAVLYDHGTAGQVQQVFANVGRPFAGWLVEESTRWVGSVTASVWWSVASILLAAAGWFLAFLRSQLVTPTLAVVMAVMAAVVPANQLIVVLSAYHFFFAHALFAVGLWLYLEWQLHRRGALAALGATLCAVGSALLGEATSVMLVLYPLVLAVARDPAGNWTAAWRGWSLWIPTGLGMAAFITMFFGFRPVSFQQGERQIGVDPVQFVLSSTSFGLTVLVAWLPVWIALWWWFRKSPQGHGLDEQRIRRRLVALAVVSAVLSVLPFVMASRLASPSGWGLRYLYFFGSAVAWSAAAMVGTSGQGGRLGVGRRTAILLTLLTVLILWVRWPLLMARTVHEDLVTAAVRASAVARQGEVFLVRDHNDPIGAPLRDIEWSGLFQTALSRPLQVAGVELDRPTSESPWLAARLWLRQRLGWASAAPVADETQAVKERLRQLAALGVVARSGPACRFVEVTVQPAATGWDTKAFLWSLKRRIDPFGYQQWVAAEAGQRVTVRDRGHLPGCR